MEEGRYSRRQAASGPRVHRVDHGVGIARVFQGLDLETAALDCRRFRCNLFRRPEHMDYIVNAVPIVQAMLAEEVAAKRLAVDLPWETEPAIPVLGARPRLAGAIPLRCPVPAG